MVITDQLLVIMKRYKRNALASLNVNGVGGYNHFELRHYKRPYTLPGVFNKGDKNPPMLRVEEWIRDGYALSN